MTQKALVSTSGRKFYLIRVDADVLTTLQAKENAHESYNAILRRILGMPPFDGRKEKS